MIKESTDETMETTPVETEGVTTEDEIPTPRHSGRERKALTRLVPTMEGKSHSESNAALTTNHLDAHLNHSFLTMGGTVLTQL